MDINDLNCEDEETKTINDLSNAIKKLEQSINQSFDSNSIHDVINELASSYFDHYNDCIDQITGLFLEKDLIKLLHKALLKLIESFNVNDDTVKLILELLVNFSEHSEEFAQKIDSENLLDVIIDLALKDDLSRIETEEVYDFMKRCILIINNFARNPNNAIRYRVEALRRTIFRFIKTNTNDPLGITSLLILSYIIEDKDVKLLDGGSETVRILLNHIRSILNTEKRSDGFTLHELVHGLRSISSNDNIKKKIVEEGGIELLIEILEKSKEKKELEPTLNTIENLCFIDDIKTKLINEYKIEEVVKKFANNECEKLEKTVQGILWMIENKSKATHEQLKTSKKLYDVFISYSWANKNEVLKIRDHFKKSKIRVWFDEEQMVGSTIEAMAKGIENSRLFVFAISSSYKKSSNCRHEAEYAFYIKKTMIPVILEFRYKPDSWLGFIVGSKLRFEFSERRQFEEEIEKLRDSIKINLENEIDKKDEVDLYRIRVEHNENSRDSKKCQINDSIRSWTCEDVKVWLEKSELGHLKTSFVRINGALLQVMLDIRLGSMSYFNKALQKEFGMGFIDILMFHSALNKLTSSPEESH